MKNSFDQVKSLNEKLNVFDDLLINVCFSNGNRTSCRPIRSVVIHVQVIRQSNNRAAGVGFVYHKYDYRPNWTT